MGHKRAKNAVLKEVFSDFEKFTFKKSNTSTSVAFPLINGMNKSMC